MNQLSAYERIAQSVGRDGKLPQGFSLEEKHMPNQIAFMPGAMDGIGFFHTGKNNQEKTARKIAKRLKKYFKTADNKHIAAIEAILSDNRTVSMIDSVLQSIRDNHRGIDMNKVVDLSFSLIKTSGNIELIKIGIALLGLFDLGSSDEIGTVLATLALYDDFTLYAVATASNWTNGNRLIFQIAQHVDGWGKIHAVERLEAEDDAIREWILRDGCVNGVMDAYLGLTCAVKGDMISALRQEVIDDDLFGSIAILIDALLDEGPVAGISEYGFGQEALTLFLKHAKQHASSVEHLWRILILRQWAECSELGYKDELLTQSSEIVNKSDWKEKIFNAIKGSSDHFEFFCACNAANLLPVDISAELFKVVQAEPIKFRSYMPQLFANPKMASEIITRCETVLPLDEMADGMGDYLFADKLNQEHQCLDFVLPELAAYPLQGVKLIQTALHSRVIRGRNMALRALTGWVTMQGKPLADISPAIYAEIAELYEIEVNEQTKETMRKLLYEI